FSYQLCDADGECGTATVNLIINNLNDSPLPANDNVTTTENTLITVNVLSNDAGLGDGGLTVNIIAAPLHGVSVVKPDKTISFTPESGYLGNDVLTYRVCDVDGDCGTATLTIRVDNIDDIPNAVDNNFTINEEETVNWDVLSNDTGLEDGSLVVTIKSNGKHGNATVNANNTIKYVPKKDYYGKDTIVYQVCDGDGDCSEAKVLVLLNNINDIPLGTSDNFSVEEDSPGILNVLSNDNNLGDGGITVGVLINPKHGNVVVNSDNTITYTPSKDYFGKDTVKYQVCDINNECSDAFLIITVNNTDDIPLAVRDDAFANKTNPSVINILANDLNLGDGGLVVTVSAQGFHGTALVNNDKTITYTPSVEYDGKDSVTYKVCDNDGDCSEARIIFTLNSFDHIPQVVADDVTVTEDQSGTFNLLTNDTGTEDGSIILTIVSNASHGSLAINNDNTVTYNPAPDYNGNDTFTYKICDLDGDCNTGNVNITVIPVNDTPVLPTIQVTVNEDNAIPIPALNDATGLGDGGILVTITGDGTHGVASVTENAITYTPEADFNGSDILTIKVCDTDGDCATSTVNITIEAVNDTPVAVKDLADSEEDQPVAIDVLSNDAGLGDGGITISLVGNPKHGEAIITNNKILSYSKCKLFWQGFSRIQDL
ncbi:MAG: tandem-95 repeat protein, partial [Bacteroidales bacterium]|nr:tandem-95 repeat protein [Bacteroidales bacterium]